MTREGFEAKMRHAHEQYMTGRTLADVAAELGMHRADLGKSFHRRGLAIRPRGWNGGPNRLDMPTDDIVSRYSDGESVKAIAEHFGVSRGVIHRRLTEANVTPRGASEATTLVAARQTSEQRANQVRAAHEAVRGSRHTEPWLESVARTRERRGEHGVSPGTDRLCGFLADDGILFTREKAVGRYNVDVALSSHAIAVEVLGGTWHARRPVHAQRTPYILNRGWDMLFVWDTKRVPLDVRAYDYLVGWSQEPGRNPSAGGEYRVVRGDGQLVSTGRHDDDDFTLVQPSVRGLDRRSSDLG
jgi:transposase